MVALEKRVALFSYSRSVENIMYLLFREGSWHWYALLSFSNSTHTAWNPNIRTKRILKHYFFFMGPRLNYRKIFISWGSLILVCTIFLNSTRTAIRMERICGAPFLFLAARFQNIVHFYFLKDLDFGMHHLPEFSTHTAIRIEKKLWSTIFIFSCSVWKYCEFFLL